MKKNRQIKERNTIDRMMRMGTYGWKSTKEKAHKSEKQYSRKNYRVTFS